MASGVPPEVLQQGAAEFVGIQRCGWPIEFFHPFLVFYCFLPRRLHQRPEFLLVQLLVHQLLRLRQPQLVFAGNDEVELFPYIRVARCHGQTEYVADELIELGEHRAELPGVVRRGGRGGGFSGAGAGRSTASSSPFDDGRSNVQV